MTRPTWSARGFTSPRPALLRGPLLCGAAALLASCAGDAAPPPRAGDPAPVDSSLRAFQTGSSNVLASPAPGIATDPANDQIDAWSRAALDLQSVLDGAARNPPTNPGTLPLSPEQPGPGAEPTTPEPVTPLPASLPPSDQTGLHTAPPQTASENIDSLARDLADALIREATSPDNPLAPVQALRLAMLESLLPGAAGDGIDLDARLLGTLAPVEARHVRAARDLARAWTASAQSGTLDDATGALAAAARELRPASGSLRTFSALCQRVSGYGTYIEFAANELIAGRALDVIVYTELEGFADRSVTPSDNPLPGDLWAVDITQELTLYHDPSDNLQAWHRPRARVVSTSRRHRQEFYLVNQVRLPANLTIGRYRLKVLTRDETSGAVSESWVSLSVVASTGSAASTPP